MTNLKTPTNELVNEYIDKFNNDERDYLADQAIINLFEKFPENKKLEDILLKISVINDLYSTNIFGTFIMAKHIQRLQIDNALLAGDPTIVNKIAVGHGISKPKGKGDRNFYSFATKYCNWHNKDAYPIYDSFVHKILIAYRNKDSFSIFEEDDLKDFTKFRQIITDFQNRYSLMRHNLKEIDKFLWIYGQEIYPNTNYKKSIT
ncbi:MAG: hypothetical protein ACYC44_03840 [Patescibacteria group bacterium]